MIQKNSISKCPVHRLLHVLGGSWRDLGVVVVYRHVCHVLDVRMTDWKCWKSQDNPVPDHEFVRGTRKSFKTLLTGGKYVYQGSMKRLTADGVIRDRFPYPHTMFWRSPGSSAAQTGPTRSARSMRSGRRAF